MSELIRVSIKEGVATITLNRPEKRNALNGQLVVDFKQALLALQIDTKVSVVVLRGEGEHFCAGGDIHWMQKMAEENYETNYQDALSLAELLYQLYFFPKPTLALAHGATLGGGMGLLSACDVVIASRDASFGLSEVKIGIAPSVISPYVIGAIGERQAHYYFLTGDRFDAETALRLGFAHQVVVASHLQQAGDELTKKLLLNSPNAMKAAKQLIYRVSHEKMSESLMRQTAEHLADLRISPEGKEGIRAFVEKRPAEWGKS